MPQDIRNINRNNTHHGAGKYPKKKKMKENKNSKRHNPHPLTPLNTLTV
jgi:hypothetical protein